MKMVHYSLCSVWVIMEVKGHGGVSFKMLSRGNSAQSLANTTDLPKATRDSLMCRPSCSMVGTCLVWLMPSIYHRGWRWRWIWISSVSTPFAAAIRRTLCAKQQREMQSTTRACHYYDVGRSTATVTGGGGHGLCKHSMKLCRADLSYVALKSYRST